MTPKNNRTPTETDRQRVDDLADRVGQLAQAADADDGLTPVVPPAEVARIKARSPFWDDEEGWRRPGELDSVTTLEEWRDAHNAYFDDRIDVYGREAVMAIETDRLRRARDHAAVQTAIANDNPIPETTTDVDVEAIAARMAAAQADDGDDSDPPDPD